MSTQKLFSLKTHLGYLNLGFYSDFLSPKMSLFFTYLFTLFALIKQCFLRLNEKFITQKKSTSIMLVQPREVEKEKKSMIIEENLKTCNVGDEDEKPEEPESFLRFSFPTYDEFIESNVKLVSSEKASFSTDKVLGKNSSDNSVANSGDNSVHDYEFFGSEVSLESVVSLSEDETISVDDSVHVDEDLFGSEFSSESLFSGGEGDVDSADGYVVHEEVVIMPQLSSESVVSRGGEDVDSADGCVHDLEVIMPQLSSESVVSRGEEVDRDVDDSIHVEENVVEPIVSSESVILKGEAGDGSADSSDKNGEGQLCFETVKTTYDFFDVGSVTEEDSSKVSLQAEVPVKNVMVDPVVSSDDEDDPTEVEVEKGEQLSESIEGPMNNALYSSDDDDDESLVSSSSFRSSFIDSISDGFLSDLDFERAFELDTSMEFDVEEEKSTANALTEEDIDFQNLSKEYESADCEGEDEEVLDELKGLEEEVNLEDKQNGDKSSSGEQLSSESEEQNDLEKEWEHQNLVEQLKMEIKKARAIGLPTILEESESPKITDDLKPWKIEEKYQREGTMDELHKFYKSYKEKMRKLDILNYQKMYAFGFLRLKDPLKSFTKNGISTPALATIVALDCWPCKSKLSEVHQPVMKFTRELESDLEMIYVGQMCLSWEFLHWQYGKALELLDSDPHGIRQYNEVAEKFQQFQVLLNRFIEDEPFQGPRVQLYAKSRCVHRNLLQVPVIREDNSRDRKKEGYFVSSKDAITSVKLVEIIEETIRIFWKFVHSDKDTSNKALVKCRRGTSKQIQSPDTDRLAEVRALLEKKAKKLKELSRSENCILRKFQKHHDDGSDQHLYFFSQVDMKLISRVLCMSRITSEQLVWCTDKLSRIVLVGRKLHVEPSFLLFPCS